MNTTKSVLALTLGTLLLAGGNAFAATPSQAEPVRNTYVEARMQLTQSPREASAPMQTERVDSRLDTKRLDPHFAARLG